MLETKIIEYIAHRRESDQKIQTLETHLSGVAAKSKILAAKIGLDSAGELIGLLHDLGKYSLEFQNYIKSGTGMLNPDKDDGYVDADKLKGKIDHSSAGAQFIWNHLAQHGTVNRLIGQILALCIASHHSGLIDCLKPDGENNFERRIKKDDQKTHLSEIMQKIDENILSQAEKLLKNIDLLDNMRKSILAIMKQDHQDDTQPHLNIIIQFKLGLLVRYLFSCLIDADRMDTADFENPRAAKKRHYGVYKDWSLLIKRLETHLGKFKAVKEIDQIRRDISQHCLDKALMSKGIFTLTVPTGGGKTLASLRFALHHAKHHGMERIIYVIPYTSIIEQNAKVVREILEIEGDEASSVILEHHSNLTPQLQTWKSKILSENWDSPIIYTTTVQLLETLFDGGNRDVRRMHQLANAMIIFDEIQTLPIRCTHMFCNAMNFLVERCGSSVMLCTATQPLLNDLHEKQKGYLKIHKERELIPDVSKLFEDLKRVEILNKIRPDGWSDEEIVQLAIKEMNDSSSCLVIVNTKIAAKNIFQKCHELVKNKIYHLSTDMCPAHRLKVLDELKSKLNPAHKEPVICISTQLIEAGVDIDFGSVIRFAAGMDSIAQAAGRCNRNGEAAIGRVYIVNPQAENLERLVDIRIGKEKTQRILNEFKKIESSSLLSPEIMKQYFNYYFFERSKEMDYQVSPKEVGHHDSLLRLLSINDFAEANDLWFPNTLRHSFMSAADAFRAIDSPTRGVIVPYGEQGKSLIIQLCAAFNIEEQFKLLKTAQRYTVNVFPHQFQKLEKESAIHEFQEGTGIFYLDDQYYSEEFGLSTTSVNLLQPLINY